MVNGVVVPLPVMVQPVMVPLLLPPASPSTPTSRPAAGRAFARAAALDPALVRAAVTDMRFLSGCGQNSCLPFRREVLAEQSVIRGTFDNKATTDEVQLVLKVYMARFPFPDRRVPMPDQGVCAPSYRLRRPATSPPRARLGR